MAVQPIKGVVDTLGQHEVLNRHDNHGEHVVFSLGFHAHVKLLHPQRDPSADAIHDRRFEVQSRLQQAIELAPGLEYAHFLLLNHNQRAHQQGQQVNQQQSTQPCTGGPEQCRARDGSGQQQDAQGAEYEPDRARCDGHAVSPEIRSALHMLDAATAIRSTLSVCSAQSCVRECGLQQAQDFGVLGLLRFAQQARRQRTAAHTKTRRHKELQRLSRKALRGGKTGPGCQAWGNGEHGDRSPVRGDNLRPLHVSRFRTA
ncbi:MAG: hypothetical protein HPKKFMNG_01124 [Planctomycetes bacterium]|nr:hypothetical protein [Planctomycetota bacterium]